MEEFLTVLKTQLMERLTPADLDEQMELYENYFREELAAGKSMEQILRKLGDPARVAELIVENEEGIRHEEEENQARAARDWFREKTPEEINAEIVNPEHGFHAEFKENEGWDVRLGKFKINTWYGTLIILGIVLVIFVLFSQLIHR